MHTIVIIVITEGKSPLFKQFIAIIHLLNIYSIYYLLAICYEQHLQIYPTFTNVVTAFAVIGSHTSAAGNSPQTNMKIYENLTHIYRIL